MQVNIIVSPPVTLERSLFVSIKIDGMVRVAAATPHVKVADCPYNKNEMAKMIREAAANGASVIAFPELAMTGYTCGDLFKDRKLMESAKACLFDLIEETEDLDILCAVGMPIPSGGALSNCAAVFSRGVLLGLPFPAGKYVDELYYRADSTSSFRVKVNELYFSLSGVENKVKSLREMGETEANIARFAVDTVVGAVYRVTNTAKKMYPGLPVLCSGGVASNSVLRSVLQDTVFALPEYSRDNAMGIAVLARRVWESREAQR